MAASFRFRRFSVTQDESALKVGTDAVLLGAAVSTSGNETRALDIGTGTGVIALMLAQRIPGCIIDAIDIDAPSAREAAANFAASPWAGRLNALAVPLEEFGTHAPAYGLIVSNPPYYDASLRNPDAREAAARHCESLSYREICAFASAHLSPAGRLALILPSDCERQLLRTARSFGLSLDRIIRIRTTEAKPPRRIIAEFIPDQPRAGTPRSVAEEALTLQRGGTRTEEYRRLTEDFYLQPADS